MGEMLMEAARHELSQTLASGEGLTSEDMIEGLEW
jgi:hypothetical protein